MATTGIPRTTCNDHGFLGRLREKIVAAGNGLCVGIDPPLDGLPTFFSGERHRRGPGDYLEVYARTLCDAAAAVAPAVKFQSAYFEAYGAAGFAALERSIAHAKSLGLITLLDAKRGDITATMAAYGHMAFESMAADALTVSPYMGLDVVEPLLPWLKQGRGVYVVWVSSNPGGTLIQDQVALPLLDALLDYFKAHAVEAALGLVLGATKIESLPAAVLPKLRSTGLLMPGVGAQGGTITPRIKEMIAATGTVLVPLSRGIAAMPSDCRGWDEYGQTVLARLQRMAAELR